ncbi:EcsC family protein [Candidatus Hydrogenedentota bacterium]
MKLSEYEVKALEEIAKWEKTKYEGLHKRILDMTSKPVDAIIKKVGKKRFSVFEKAIGRTVRRLLDASTHTIEPEELVKRARSHGIMIKDIFEIRECDLELIDKCNRKNINFHEKAAAVQGAAAGLGGGLVATADITAVLIQDFHMIQEIAFCHAYDPNTTAEKQIILHIIEGALGGSEMKFEALEEIEALARVEDESDVDVTTRKGVPVLSAKALEDFIEHLASILIVRLVPRAIPILSMVVSAHSNHEIMEHSGNMAFMVYRKRFIERKRKL